MRISALVGVLLGTLIFLGGPAKAEAITIEEKQNKVIETPAAELLAKTIIDSPINESKQEESEKQKEPEVTKHTVSKNESLSDIAKKHQTTWRRIYNKNKNIADPNLISQGLELVIPDESEKLEDRELPKPKPIVQQTRSTVVSQPQVARSATYRGSSSGNSYVAGYCTWYVKNRRPDLPNNLGNAYSWFSNASAQGISVGYTPRAGAVGQRNNHVVYVESVNSNGTINISDMNYQALYAVTYRTVPASEFRYIY